MTRFSFRPVSVIFAAASCALLLSLTACLGTGSDDDKPDLLIRVVDAEGAPLGADTVTWSYYGDGDAVHHKSAAVSHGSDSTHKPATRVDAAGTTWMVTDPELHASVFLRASFHRDVDALCMDHGYVVKEINADKLPQEVTLTLEVARMCE